MILYQLWDPFIKMLNFRWMSTHFSMKIIDTLYGCCTADVEIAYCTPLVRYFKPQLPSFKNKRSSTCWWLQLGHTFSGRYVHVDGTGFLHFTNGLVW